MRRSKWQPTVIGGLAIGLAILASWLSAERSVVEELEGGLASGESLLLAVTKEGVVETLSVSSFPFGLVPPLQRPHYGVGWGPSLRYTLGWRLTGLGPHANCTANLAAGRNEDLDYAYIGTLIDPLREWLLADQPGWRPWEEFAEGMAGRMPLELISLRIRRYVENDDPKAFLRDSIPSILHHARVRTPKEAGLASAEFIESVLGKELPWVKELGAQWLEPTDAEMFRVSSSSEFREQCKEEFPSVFPQAILYGLLFPPGELPIGPSQQ